MAFVPSRTAPTESDTGEDLMSRHPAGRPRASNRLVPGVGRLEGRLLPSVDVLTYHDDNTRSSWDADETTLTPADVNPQSFGKLFNMAVDGPVDGQPLYMAGASIPGQGVHNVVFVTTEADSVYAFDADDGGLLWHVSLLGKGETTVDLSPEVPEIGITATPVIDPTTGTIYVVAESRSTSGGTTTTYQRLHALSIFTGADVVTPRSIDGSFTYPGSGPGGNGTDLIFDPSQYRERNALLLSNGIVYTSWSSNYDAPPYTGWVMGFNASNLAVASILNIDPAGLPTSTHLDDGSGNSFWNSGDGPAVDAQGNLYNISANGPFDPVLNNGFPANGDYGDSFVRMTPSPGALTVTDYFAPADQQNDADEDYDLGSSGIALADEPGPGGVTLHLAVGSDKLGDIYVVNRDDMGGYHASGDAIVQELPGELGAGEFGSPAVFGDIVYFGGEGELLRAFSFVNGLLVPDGQTSTTFAYPGATPSVTSDGIDDGIVWAVEHTPEGGVLHAYLATDPSVEIYNSSMAAGGRDAIGPIDTFLTPVAANGMIYVATASGVAAFGLRLTPPPIFTMPPHAATSPSVGNFVDLSTATVDASYPAADLAYFWGTLSAPPARRLDLQRQRHERGPVDRRHRLHPRHVHLPRRRGRPQQQPDELPDRGGRRRPGHLGGAGARGGPGGSPAPVVAIAAPARVVAPSGPSAAPTVGLALSPAAPSATPDAGYVTAVPASPSAWGAGRIFLVPQDLPDVASPFAVDPRGDRRPFARSTARWWLA